jgi:hypothetical protein
MHPWRSLLTYSISSLRHLRIDDTDRAAQEEHLRVQELQQQE